MPLADGDGDDENDEPPGIHSESEPEMVDDGDYDLDDDDNDNDYDTADTNMASRVRMERELTRTIEDSEDAQSVPQYVGARDESWRSASL